MKRKVALHNLGCKVNAYELEAMRAMLEGDDYTIVPFNEEADIYIVNTCTVTNIADRKSRQMLHKAKKTNPQGVVVATGCYVQASADSLSDDPLVDIIIGNDRKQELLSIIENYFTNNSKQQVIADVGEIKEYENLSIGKSGERTRVYIKVQDGCNQFCSYCIIPYMRGRVRSRQIEEVLSEAKRLADAGYAEIVLTGINLSSYGIERGEASGLLELIKAVHSIDKIKRIRLGSLEPRIITKEFVAKLVKLEKVCPHFHLSLQSGCDETLKRMNRRYTIEEFKEKCDMLREYYRNPAITTDIIVGFPGESEQEFAATMKLVEMIGFYETHIFKYSPRKNTKAATMPEQIPEQIKTKRSKELITIGKKAKGHFLESRLGCECEVLVEEKTKIDGEEYFVGHTSEYLKVAFKGNVNHVGEIVTVIAKDILDGEYIMGEITCVL